MQLDVEIDVQKLTIDRGKGVPVKDSTGVRLKSS